MKVRASNGNELPIGWHPGQPLTGPTVELHNAAECPFGPDCHACRDGFEWNRNFDTHVKPRVDRW
jgi:hypothetical protein